MSNTEKQTSTKEWVSLLSEMSKHIAGWHESLLSGDGHGSGQCPALLFDAVARSKAENPWFTEENVLSALQALSYMLRKEGAREWAERYGGLPMKYTGKRVGIVAAGNIPMVAFHDVLCVLVSGHKALVKCSSQDKVLLPALFASLEAALGTAFEIEWVKATMPQMDAVIATGSNNTSRYFKSYFKDIPHIIRRNRNSVAILEAELTEDELQALGKDIFGYFGLGCRNVSKLYVHSDFDLDRLFRAIYPFRDIIHHHKYANNYDYYKALWLLNREELLDNGFLLLRPSEALASPPGVLFYERFSDAASVHKRLDEQREDIQCVLSHRDLPFGKSQEPELWQYADGVDTVAFLNTIA